MLGSEPKNGGGTFQIRSMDFEDAQFTFYGWNRDINRRTFQVIDVRRGTNANINIAIVRKIISIIREHEQGDFQWLSKRMGREMTLSARTQDAVPSGRRVRLSPGLRLPSAIFSN